MNRTVIALGFFDGVHRGHGALLEKTAARARELEAVPAAFTFDRPPKEVVTGRPVGLINTPDDRRDLMQRLYGIRQVIIAPFDRAMMTMPWQEFIDRLLVGTYGAVHLVAGHDYHFGHRNQGDPDKLLSRCRERGIGCDIIPQVTRDGITVSSTHLRTLLKAGEMETAVRFFVLMKYCSIAETARRDGIATWFSSTPRSDRMRIFAPSLYALSHSTKVLSIAFSSEVFL